MMAIIGISPYLGGTAYAQSFRIRYRASEGCPGEQAFVAEVRKRSFTEWTLEEGPRQLVVTLEHAENGDYSGTFTLEVGGETRGARRLYGKSCDEVAHATSIMLALAIDTEVREAAKAAPPPPPPPLPKPQPKPVHRTPPAVRAPSALFTAGLGLSVESAQSAPTVGTWIERGSRRTGLWSPRLSLGFAFSFATVTAGPGTVAIRTSRVAARFCSSRLRAGALELSPCIATDVGLLAATPSNLQNEASYHKPWWSLDVLFAARFWLFESAGVEVDAGPVFPLLQWSFVTDRRTVYETPFASFKSTAALFVAF